MERKVVTEVKGVRGYGFSLHPCVSRGAHGTATVLPLIPPTALAKPRGDITLRRIYGDELSFIIVAENRGKKTKSSMVGENKLSLS